MSTEMKNYFKFFGKISFHILLTLLTLLVVFGLANAQSPAGVSDSLVLWLKANVGVTDDGSGTLTWEDQSPSGADCHTKFPGKAFYATANGDTAINFNPVIYNGGSGMINNTLSTHSLMDSAVAGYGNYTIFTVQREGIDPVGHPFYSGKNLYIGTYEYHRSGLHAYETDHVAVQHPDSGDHSANQPFIISASRTSPSSAGGIEVYSNGIALNLGTDVPQNLPYHNRLGYVVGHQFETGAVAEVIVYKGTLTSTQRVKVQSYLAMKYGITLPVNDYKYYSHGGYPFLIAGIGKDSLNGFYQPKSRSVDPDAHVTIEGTPHDGQYLTWGCNNGTFTDIIVGSLPAGYDTRVSRIWTINTTGGGAGPYTVSFDLSGTDFDTSDLEKFALLLPGLSGYFYDGSAHTTGRTLVGNTITFTNVVFTNTNGKFGLAVANSCGPGGVTDNGVLWFKANDGVTTDTTTGLTWKDAFNGFNATPKSLSNSPSLASGTSTDGINGNAAITFGDGKFLRNKKDGYSVRDFFPDRTADGQTYTIYAVHRAPDNREGTVFAHSPSEFNLSRHKGSDYASGRTFWSERIFSVFRQNATNADQISGIPHMVGINRSGNVSGDITLYSNGDSFNISNGRRLYKGRFYDRHHFILGSSRVNYASKTWKGELGEVILFNRSLTFAERQKVETYLSVKYGITIPVNVHLAFAHTNYANDIAGIGKQVASCLNQTMSMSVNEDAAVIMKADSVLQDEEYLVWGNNDKDLADRAHNQPSGYDLRMARVWRVDLTGTPGTVKLMILMNKAGIDLSKSDTSKLALLIDNNTNFVNATVHTTGRSVSGDTLIFTGVDFSDGDYFTFTAEAKCAPGGITSGFSTAVWLRSDYGVYYDESTREIDSILNFNIQGDKANSWTANDPEYSSTLDDAFNGHTAINFNDSAILGLGVGNLGSGNQKSTCIVVVRQNDTLVRSLMSFGDNSTIIRFPGGGKIKWFTKTGYAGGHVLETTGGDIVYGEEHIVTFVYDSITKEISVDGVVVGSDTSTNYILSSGGSNIIGAKKDYISLEETFDGGDMAEFIYFRRALSDNELDTVYSYLNIRYGISIPEANHIWYPHYTYDKRIAGIGNLSDLCLGQLSSTNQSVDDPVVRMTSKGLSEGEMIIWGDNGNSRYKLLTDAPSGYAGRIKRTWRTKVHGSPDPVVVSINMNDLGIYVSPQDTGKYALLLSATNSFTSATAYTSYSVDGQTLVFENVPFTNAEYFTIAVPEQAYPGGVVMDDQAIWLKANAGALDEDGDGRVNTWVDWLGYDQNAARDTLSPVHPFTTTVQGDLTDTMINYNPTMYFDSARLVLPDSSFRIGPSIPGGSEEYSIYIVQRIPKKPVGSTMYNKQFSLMAGSNDFSTARLRCAIDYSDTSIQQHNDLSYTGSDDLNTPGGLIDIGESVMLTFMFDGNTGRENYLNGVLEASDTVKHINISNQSDNYISAYEAWGTWLNSTNEIAEMIYVPRYLAKSSRDSIETYLNIKYGITIPVANHNFFSDTLYKYFIAGIGKDKANDFIQPRSKSVHDGAVVEIGTDPELMSDTSFLVWGNNGFLTGFNVSDVPSGYDARLAKQWRVAVTGSSYPVNLSFDLNELGLRLNELDTASVAILISSSALGFSTGTVISDVSISADGILQTDQAITFNNGDYFTLAVPRCGMGASVFGTYGLWYSADHGVNTDLYGTSDNVSNWYDRKPGYHIDAEQPESIYQPTYSEGNDMINFNPVLDFNGDHLELQDTVLQLGDNPHAIFIVLRPQHDSLGKILSLGDGSVRLRTNSNGKLDYQTTSPSSAEYNVLKTADSVFTPGEEYILEFKYGLDPTGKSILINGEVVAFYDTTSSPSLTPYDSFFMDQADSNALGTRFRWQDSVSDFHGEIAEVMIFNYAMNDNKQTRVRTYLNMKYGINIPWSDHQFYTHFKYPEQIAGVGNWTDACLTQNKSRSQTGESIITVDATGNFDQDEWMFWGNNGGTLDNFAADVPFGYDQRIGRIWRVKANATFENINEICFDLSAFPEITDSLDFKNQTNKIALLIDATKAPFDDATPVAASRFIDTTGVCFSNVSLSNGNYLSLAVPFKVLPDECTITEVGFTDTNSVAILIEGCTDTSGWTYFMDPNHPLKAVAAMKLNPVGGNSLDVDAYITVTTSVAPDTTTGVYSATNGSLSAAYLMGRYYNLTLEGGPLDGFVQLRLLEDSTEFAQVDALVNSFNQNQLNNMGVTYSAGWVTKDTLDHTSDLESTGIQGATSSPPDATGTWEGYDYVQWNSLSGDTMFAFGVTGRAARNSCLKMKAHLHGALLGSSSDTMTDDLRSNSLIPTLEPFTALDSFTHYGNGGGETIGTGVLSVTGQDAIVDWVLVEIRDSADNTNILQTQAALLQRDGDVVRASDGTSKVCYEGLVSDSVYVTIRHRNHLGAMALHPVRLDTSGTNAVLDTATLYGTNSTITYASVHALWSGNVIADHKVVNSGTGSDFLQIKNDVVGHTSNAFHSTTYSFSAYHQADLNLSGTVNFSGVNNDADVIKSNVIDHPSNSFNSNTYQIQEQLPEN